MFLPLFYLFFFVATGFGLITILSKFGSVTHRITSALATVLFLALALQSYAVQQLTVLVVNGAVVQHITNISDLGFSSMMYGMAVIFFIIAFLSNIFVLKEAVK